MLSRYSWFACHRLLFVVLQQLPFNKTLQTTASLIRRERNLVQSLSVLQNDATTPSRSPAGRARRRHGPTFDTVPVLHQVEKKVLEMAQHASFHQHVSYNLSTVLHALTAGSFASHVQYIREAWGLRTPFTSPVRCRQDIPHMSGAVAAYPCAETTDGAPKIYNCPSFCHQYCHMHCNNTRSERFSGVQYSVEFALWLLVCAGVRSQLTNLRRSLVAQEKRIRRRLRQRSAVRKASRLSPGTEAEH